MVHTFNHQHWGGGAQAGEYLGLSPAQPGHRTSSRTARADIHKETLSQKWGGAFIIAWRKCFKVADLWVLNFRCE